jgi:ribosome biogenesis GTPase
MKARELGKNSVVVGDQVALVGDTSGSEGSLSRIVSVYERKNSLTRTVDDAGALERMIVANVDQMVIVIAAANPEPRSGLVDRCLVVAFDQGIEPIILITKGDLADANDFLKPYLNLGVKTLQTSRGGDLIPIKELLRNKTSVLIGHSGVGKSTLVNALLDTDVRAVGDVNDVTGRGRHTSSSAVALKLPDFKNQVNSGWIIDTPGVRSFGLRHVDRDRVIGSFSDFADVINKCAKNCSHDEVGCELDLWAGSETARKERVKSLRGLLNSDE